MDLISRKLSIITAPLIVIGMAVITEGCVNQVPTATNACPCANGYVCCDAGVCATDQVSCSAATAALSQSIQGTWTGYIENFDLGSDGSLNVSISTASDGTLSGQVTIGQGTPPAPATDPALPWPVDLTYLTPPPAYFPGFVYTAQNISWQSRRLQFLIERYEPWQPWCALQTSYQLDSDAYSCLAGGSLESYPPAPPQTPTMDTQENCYTATTPSLPVNCEVAILCDSPAGCICTTPNFCNCGGSGVCDCDATGCHADTEFMSSPVGYSFDLTFNGDEGDGSVNLSAGGSDVHNVRLNRATTP